MAQNIEIPPVNIVIAEVDRLDDADAIQPRIIFLNSAAATLLGYDESELMNKNLAVIFPPDAAGPSWRAALNELIKTKADQTFTGEMVTKAKRWIGVFITLTLIPGQTRDKNSILMLFQDSGHAVEHSHTEGSQCQEVESALTESEERFRQMTTMAGEWLWEQDRLGFYIYSSTAVNQILGYTQEEVIGKHYTEFLTPEDKFDQQCYSDIARPFYGLTNHYQHKDGHRVITESTGLPIFDERGKLLKWRGVDRDITAKRHSEEALIESEKRIRLIIESSLSAIVIMDSFGIITDWNQQAEKMFGWSRAEAIGQRLDELIIPPRFRKAHRQGLQKFLRTGKGQVLNRLTEQVAIRRDQTEFPIELSISPLKLENTYSFSGFIHDISFRKAAEREIREGQIKLAIAHNEINIARKIQASLSPSTPIKTRDFEVTGYCLPADKVGGDYYDYFYRDECRVDMIIADVSGHSIGPALFMVETRSAIRSQNKGEETPAEKLTLLNHFLFEDLDHSDYFITLFYLQYDTRKRQLRFANAGHPPPLLYRAAEKNCIQLDAEGLIIGVKKNVNFEEKTDWLSPGDAILFYTDGLTEAENVWEEFFGTERVCDFFIKNAELPPQKIIDLLVDELKEFCSRDSFKDDVTLMVFKCR
ncbi:MAG: SpoIIE family protein phosphatase [Gammaproteobacteria bacterium]